MEAGFFDVHLRHFLVLGAALLCLGVYTVLTRRNAVALLMGVELILNSANINFVAFARYVMPAGDVRGSVMAVFVILLAAAEAAIALAIVLALTKSAKTVYVDEADRMRL